MRAFQIGAFVALAAVASQGRCASVIIEKHPHPGGVAHAIFLDGGVHNGIFTAVDFKVAPASAEAPFINQSSGLDGGVPRLPGAPFSFLNSGVPLTFAGITSELKIGDWPKLGAKNLPTEVGFGSGPLGQKIDTRLLPGGRLFLANVMLPSADARLVGSFRVANASGLLQEIVIPEPAADLLAAACVGAALVARRNRV